MEKQESDIKIVVRNRRARHDYQIESTIEAGIELQGSEVKSLRQGKVNISDAYALIDNNQVILRKLHISPYKMAAEPLDPTRPRKLLLHRREIRKLKIRIEQRGMSLIPLVIYFKGAYAKIELGLGIGRRRHDKRQQIAKAEADRKMRRAVRKDASK